MASDTFMTLNRLGFTDSEMQDFTFLRALAFADYQAASAGEVLEVARRIAREGGGRDAYVRAWAEQGRSAASRAADALGRGRRRTARVFLHRAYNYLRAAEFYFDRGRAREFAALYEESVAHFDRALPLLDFPARKISIPYQPGVDLPGHLFTASRDGAPRPTVVVCGGGDGHGEELYFLAGAPEALARGLNVLLFHGPGQRGLLHRHPRQVFRADAEVPLGAVLDHAVSLPEVDAARVGLYGLSFGGYLAPRAAARDRRVAALAANSPITDFHAAVTQVFSPALPCPPGEAPPELWNDLYDRTGEADWALGATMDNYMLWTTGAADFADFMRVARTFTLDGLVERIGCPTLTLTSEGENAVQREQALSFHERLPAARKDLFVLTAADGADSHCGVGNIALTGAVVYDWFAEVLSA